MQRPSNRAQTKGFGRRQRRQGNILLLSMLLMIILLGMVAFAVDMGVIVNARTEAQRAADSAALAAAWEMVSDGRIMADDSRSRTSIRQVASQYAGFNDVANRAPTLMHYQGNSTDGDIVIGRLSNPSDLSQSLVLNSVTGDNAVTVRVRMLNSRNSAVPLSFARLLGVNATDVVAEATAIFDDNTVGFRTNSENPNSGLMPFVVHVDAWQDLLDGLTGSDNWTYNPATGTTSPGSDGIPEISMFPGGGGSSSGSSSNGNGNGNGNGNSNGGGQGQNQVAPGNFGTVDIGNSNNSAADLRRQIEFGPNQQDFDYHGGELKLNSQTQSMDVNGDTGMTVSMQSALENIVGDSRSIMLYDSVTGTGNNAMFTIVGFVGMRVMDFDLNGGNKYLLIQPAMVTDPTAISGNYGQSYFVGQPVRLVR